MVLKRDRGNSEEGKEIGGKWGSGGGGGAEKGAEGRQTPSHTVKFATGEVMPGARRRTQKGTASDSGRLERKSRSKSRGKSKKGKGKGKGKSVKGKSVKGSRKSRSKSKSRGRQPKQTFPVFKDRKTGSSLVTDVFGQTHVYSGHSGSGNRPSPSQSATEFAEGVVARGNNGKLWQIKTYWRKPTKTQPGRWVNKWSPYKQA